MKEILDSLSKVVEQTIAGFSAKRPGCRFALDCNAEYGEVFVAVDTSPTPMSVDALLAESAEEFFGFGDWPIPDLSFEDPEVEALWKSHWSRHEAIIRDDWLDLPDCEQTYRHRHFLQGVCAIAADLSRRLPGIVPPILAADHDEPFCHTTARLRWALNGPPSPAHSRLVFGAWECTDNNLLNKLCFFQDGTFINHVLFHDDPTCAIEAEGDWRLADGSLVMNVYETNLKKSMELLFKDISYDLLVLDDHTLEYREEDGTVYAYTRSGLPE